MFKNKIRNTWLNIAIIVVMILPSFLIGEVADVQAESLEMPLLLSSMTRSTTTNIPIPDLDIAYACFDFSGAPSTAVVDYIDVSFNIDHDWVADLVGWIGHGSWNSADDHGYYVIDHESATGNDVEILPPYYDETIDKTITGYYPPSGSYFYDGRSTVNQLWCLAFEDEWAGDDGRIDSASITLYYHVAKPDLTITDLSTSSSIITEGHSFYVDYTSVNIGDWPSTIFENEIYMSTNTYITTSDTLLGSTAMDALDIDEANDEHKSVTIPDGTSEGTYYIGVLTDVDDLNDESDEGNNGYDIYESIYVIPQTYDVQVGKTGSGSGTITSSPSGINCGSTCTTSFNEGTSVTLTASPATGSRIVTWHGGTGTCSGSGTTCSFTLNNLVQTYVDFGLLEYTLSVSTTGTGSGTVTSSPSGINCGSGGSDCLEDYDYGTSVSLTPSPATGSTFTGWSGACTGTGSCNVSMTAARSVSAEFTETCYSLSRDHVGVGSDPTASPTNSSGCSIGQYHAGESITMTAHPASGYHLDYWTGTDSSSSSHLTMPGGTHNVTAYYTQDVIPCYTLNRDHVGMGSDPTASPTNSSGCSIGQYHSGESITMTAHPASGYHLDYWTGTDSSSSSHLTMPGYTHNVTAYYVINPSNLGDNVGFYVPDQLKWYLKNNQTDGWTEFVAFKFGGPSGSLAVSGDWDNDGVDTVGFYVPAQGKWYLKNNQTDGWTDFVAFNFGGPTGSIPVAGDWDNDGVDTVGFYVPSQGKWYLKNNQINGWNDYVAFNFGGPTGSQPVAGDWDNDGVDTVGFYVPSQGKWYLKNNQVNGWNDFVAVNFAGATGSLAVAGDWDDDSVDTIGFYVPSQMKWYLKNNQINGWNDFVAFKFGGPSGSQPVAGDWD